MSSWVILVRFVHLSVCPSVCLFGSLSVYPSVCSSGCLVCLFVRLAVCLVCLFVCQFVCLSACLFVCQFVSLSVCSSICLFVFSFFYFSSVFLSDFLVVCLSVCLCICLLVRLPVCLPVYLFVCLFVCLCVYLSVCLSAVRKDILPPLSVVEFTVDRLLDSNDKTRRSSVLMMISILRSMKPFRKRIKINPCHDLSGNKLPFPSTIGIREDNLWICFNEENVPSTEEAYDNAIFIDKMWPG